MGASMARGVGKLPASGVTQRREGLQRTAGNRAVTGLLRDSATWQPSDGSGVGAPRHRPPEAQPPVARAAEGEPLDADTRRRMEAGLGHDFSGVRVHHDEPAAHSAMALGADAYTIGSDIVFAPGGYDPASPWGWHMLAHELGHVVQQQGRVVAPGEPPLIAGSDDTLEQNADRAADRVGDASPTEDPRASAHGVWTRGARTSLGAASRLMVQRQATGKAKQKDAPAKPRSPAKQPEIKWTFGQVLHETSPRRCAARWRTVA